jgi:hypothetical protein
VHCMMFDFNRICEVEEDVSAPYMGLTVGMNCPPSTVLSIVERGIHGSRLWMDRLIVGAKVSETSPCCTTTVPRPVWKEPKRSTMHDVCYWWTHCWCERSRNVPTIPYGVYSEFNTFNVHGEGVLKSVATHNNSYCASWQFVAAQLVSSYLCSGVSAHFLAPFLARTSHRIGSPNATKFPCRPVFHSHIWSPTTTHDPRIYTESLYGPFCPDSYNAPRFWCAI